MEWNAEPILFQLGPIAIRYYSLMFIIGFISMSYYVKKVFQADGHDPKLVDSLTNHIIVGMIVGARLAHCFFYDPGYYLSNPHKILMVWEGGLASHGGYLGVIIAVSLFIKKNPKINFLWLMDNIAGPCLFVGGLIRIGNFMNSEIIGKASDLPWAIIFKKVDLVPRHPAQLYEAIGYFSVAFLYMYLSRKAKGLKNGAVLAIAMILSFLFRFFVEFAKDNQSTISDSLPINMGQILSLCFMMGGVYLYLKVQKPSRA